MALTAIQRELWAAQLDAFLTTMTVAGSICDTNVVPAMDGGDTWHIVTPTDISTFSVADGSDITYSLPTDGDTSVTKNFDKGFALLELDTNVMQSGNAGWIQAFSQNGAYQLSADLDTAVLANHAAAGTNFQEAGSAWQFTVTTCAEVPVFFAQLLKKLRDQKVDGLGMPYVVGPTGFGEAIDTYTSKRGTQLGDESLLAGGQRTFTYGGFRVFISNNCNTAASITHGLAGIMGYGYALGRYIKPDMLEDLGRSEGRFGNLYRGRLAAGYKVYRSAAVVDVEFNSVVVATS